MIRALQPSDIDHLVQLWLHLACTGHPSLPVEFWRLKLGKLEQGLHLSCSQSGRTHCRWVYCDPGNSRAEGLATVNGDRLNTLFTSPSLQGRGVGSALMAQAKLDHPQLQIILLEENLRGRYFCQQHGFVELDRRLASDSARTEIDMRYRK